MIYSVNTIQFFYSILIRINSLDMFLKYEFKLEMLVAICDKILIFYPAV